MKQIIAVPIMFLTNRFVVVGLLVYKSKFQKPKVKPSNIFCPNQQSTSDVYQIRLKIRN